MFKRALWIGIWPLVAAWLLGGCVPHSAGFLPIERDLVAQNPDRALTRHLEKTPPSRDRLLYVLDAAILERINGNFAQSNHYLAQAKELIETYSVVSVSEQAGTFILNDATTAYAGEEFEQVLVYLYSALNYLELGDLYAARVEALQVDVRLQEMALRGFRGHYGEDPLARYLSGVVFEALGEESDAMIAYRRSYEAFGRFERHFGVPIPRRLGVELLRFSEQMGLADEYRRYETRFGPPPKEESQKSVEVIAVVSVGLSPLKHEASVLVQQMGGQLIRVSLPTYETRPKLIESVQVRLAAGETIQAERFHPIDAIAQNTLEAKMPAITARAIARMVAKYNVAQQADDKAGPVAGFVANVIGVLTESADTRSWFTLPESIYLARFALTPGRHDLWVEGLGRGGGVVVRHRYDALEVDAGSYLFLTPHLIPPYARERRR